jgi:hypothetical protein
MNIEGNLSLEVFAISLKGYWNYFFSLNIKTLSCIHDSYTLLIHSIIIIIIIIIILIFSIILFKSIYVYSQCIQYHLNIFTISQLFTHKTPLTSKDVRLLHGVITSLTMPPRGANDEGNLEDDTDWAA